MALSEQAEEILETFGELLADAGHRVTCCGTGMGALLRIGAERPDLVLLDLNLGDLSGFDIHRTLRADRQLADIPVLFISGVVLDQDLLRERVGDPEARLLLKPIDPTLLLEEIQRACRQARRAA